MAVHDLRFVPAVESNGHGEGKRCTGFDGDRTAFRMFFEVRVAKPAEVNEFKFIPISRVVDHAKKSVHRVLENTGGPSGFGVSEQVLSDVGGHVLFQ